MLQYISIYLICCLFSKKGGGPRGQVKNLGANQGESSVAPANVFESIMRIVGIGFHGRSPPVHFTKQVSSCAGHAATVAHPGATCLSSKFMS
ncbi:MAG: hypothetical protein WBN75_07555 [Verrucomicrobiia bacterium]